MVLNKKDTSILTLTLLLSIATSPVAWATSRWNSNSSVTSSAVSESSLWSSGRVRNIDIKSESEDWGVQNLGDFKLKSESNSTVRLSSELPISLSQIDSRLSPANTNNDSLVGQSSQMQPGTLPATEGEIPIWLWWLLPVVPFLGLWINLQFKAQRSKSPVKKQENLVSVPLSTKPDFTGEQPQKNSDQIDFNSLTEPLKNPFSPNINKQFIEPLKTPFSPTITTFSLPRTIIKKGDHPKTLQLEDHLQTQESSISLMESEVDNLDSAIAIPHQASILSENEVKTKSEIEFLISSDSPEPEFYPIENGGVEEVSEVVLIKEIDQNEAEAVIAEFLTTKTIIDQISVLEIVESEPEIQHESVILESDITETESIVVAVDDELTESEISVLDIVEAETEVIELGVFHQEVRSETDVAATKFNIGKEIKFEPSLADVDQGLPPLPDGYGHSQIFLLPRDPNWAYAYWDIPNEHKEHIRRQGGKHLLLRVYDVTAIDLDTQPPLSVQEYECDEMAREWHIPIAMSDRDYIAELGYLTLDGRWLVLVRSNHIHIPPIYPTDWENYQFINIPWDEDLRGKTFFKL